MARQERPVDPTAGPLQSLANDLRKLRVEGGSPTYRALARKTGYSASTLSEAASGVRKPTLDVLLAYVGALGGDLDAWRDRWNALDDRPEAPPTAAAPQVRPAEEPTRPAHEPGPRAEPGRPAEEPGPQSDAVRMGRRPAWMTRRLALAGVLVLALVAAGLTWRARRADSPVATAATTAATTAAAGCPEVPATAAFTATTYASGAKVRQGPARTQRELYTVPAGCKIGLTGYCLGEVIIDATAGTPDIRWFTVAGGGVVASAVVHGNPPAGTSAGRCDGDRAAPSSITLAVAGGKQSKVTLRATGRGVDIVGYAAYYADSADLHASASWHQIGLTGAGDDGFAVPWRIDRLPGGAKPIVAAAACLGGDGPTGVVDLRTLAANGAAVPATAEPTAAARTACLYPVAK